MSTTSDLAAAYVTAAGALDKLYYDLFTKGSTALANQVAQAEANLKQAASTLATTDALEQLDPTSPDVTTIANLTDTINKKAAAIQSAENKVSLVTGLASTLLSTVTDVTAGNIAGGIAAAGQAISDLKQL